MIFFPFLSQSNLFFKDDPPSSQEKSALGDLFVSALSLRKTSVSSSSSVPSTHTTASTVSSTQVAGSSSSVTSLSKPEKAPEVCSQSLVSLLTLLPSQFCHTFYSFFSLALVGLCAASVFGPPTESL